MKFFVLAVLSLASSASAQSQRAQLPACVVACDNASIATSGCTDSDLTCHCTHYSTIYQSVIPCILQRSNCTDPTRDLLTLEQGFATACRSNLNITIPTGITVIPNNGTSNTTSGIGNSSSAGTGSSSAPSSSATFLGSHGSPNSGSLHNVNWIIATAALAILMVLP